MGVDGFVHQRRAGRVVFGTGALARVPDEVDLLGCRRVLLIGGGSATAAAVRLGEALGVRLARHLDRVVQHVPADLAAEAVAAAREAGADAVCSVGGGSATGLAKAVAVECGLPVVAVPTTYAGSEATDVYGVRGERKRVGRDARALPRTVVYDPELTATLPARVTASSGLNALAHAVAALGSGGGDRIAAAYGAEAARLIARSLPVAVPGPARDDVRVDLMLAAYLAGSGFAAVGSGLQHRLSHLVGGRYGAVHADAHAALLPHTVALDDALDANGMARLAEVLGSGDAAGGVAALARAVGAPLGLADVGVPAGDLDDLAAEASATIDGHPHSGDVAWFRELLAAAYSSAP